MLSMLECIAALFAPFRFSAPMYRDMSEFAPAPIPFPNPTKTMNNGVTYPIAARGSAPSPATHMLSMMLFKNIRNMLAISGHASLFMAFLGSPVTSSIFEFFSIIIFLVYAIVLLYMQE